jgi:hypothetical protein
VTQRRGTPLSAVEARRGGARRWLSLWAARWAVVALAGPWRERKGRGEIGRPRGGKKKRGWAKPETGRDKGNPFPFYIFQLLLKPFEKNLQNQFEKKELHSIKIYMQQHECTYMCLDLIVDFISKKNYFLTISQCSHQIIKSICLFGKVKFLGCYNSTPLKMNLVLEIRLVLTQTTEGMIFLNLLLFPR